LPDDSFFDKDPNPYESGKFAESVGKLLMEKQEKEYDQFLDRLINRAHELQRRDREEIECLKIQIRNLERGLHEQKAVAERADKLFQERDAKIADLMAAAGVGSYELLRDYITKFNKLRQDNSRLLTALQGIAGICKHHFRIDDDERKESAQTPYVS
jgi:hypothetical protein